MSVTALARAHTIGLLLSNKAGVLNRVTLVFSRRGWNIDSLSVSPRKDERISHCTIVARGDSATLFVIMGQLRKLVDVIEAEEYFDVMMNVREFALVHLSVEDESWQPFLAQFDIEWTELERVEQAVTVELRGGYRAVDETCRGLADRFHVVNLVRSGKMQIEREGYGLAQSKATGV
ncbi:MAG: acetolactate synthase small subunit [Myxococcota bacterium]|nr:acetolactate synthase small subunit [Myxococcota bacterium]